MECKSKKKLLLILLTAFVLFTFAPNVFATVNTPSFPSINVNQLTPTTIQRFNTEFKQNNLSYKMFIGSDGKTYLNVWSDGSGARDVYVWSATDNKWTFSTTLSSNTLVKGAEEPQTPATSRYATWDEYVRSISGGKSGEGGQAPNIPTGSSGYAGVIIPILLAGAAAAAGGYVGSGVVFEPAPLPRCDTVTCTAVTGCTGYSGGGICPSVDCSSVYCLTYTGGCPSNCGVYCSCNTNPCSCNTNPCSCNTKPTCSSDCSSNCACNTKPTCSSDCPCNTKPCDCVSGYCPCNTKPCDCVSGYCPCNTNPCSCNTNPCSCNTKPTCSSDCTSYCSPVCPSNCTEFCNPVYPGGCSSNSCPTYDPCSTNTGSCFGVTCNGDCAHYNPCRQNCSANCSCVGNCSCNTKPTCSSDCSCNTKPCDCVSGYCPCNTKPCDCVSGYCPCNTKPCSCNTKPCSCVSGYCSCNTKPCGCVKQNKCKPVAN